MKYSSRGESLYFDSVWQAQTDYPSLRQSKHIYVGQSRVATQLNVQGHQDVGYENVNTYYYHSDHLGSSQVVSDYAGKEYERNEYTPYGELWVEKESDTRGLLAFKFTGKELDSETGLYYYGARYLNPRTSRWASPDPVMEEYLPKAPVNDQARQGSRNLPGFGGVFNPINLAMYQYAANNPVKYKDPTGLRTGPDDFDTVYYPPPQRQTEITSVTTNSSFYKNSTEYNVSQVASGVRYNETMQKVQVHTNTTTFTSETTLDPKNQRYAQGQSNGPSLSVEVTFTVSTKTSEGLCKVHIATQESDTAGGVGVGFEYPIPKGETYSGVKVQIDFTVQETGKSYEQDLFINEGFKLGP